MPVGLSTLTQGHKEKGLSCYDKGVRNVTYWANGTLDKY
jgi:hypothetical protein